MASTFSNRTSNTRWLLHRVRSILLVYIVAGSITPVIAQPYSPPFDPWAERLTPIADVQGGITKRIGDIGEQYGRYVWSVGDVNNDGLSDWIIQHMRTDTVWTDTARPIGRKIQKELLLYTGQQGKAPAYEGGVRIGPTEIMSESEFLASGDWDNDRDLDLAIGSYVYGDTSNGNVAHLNVYTVAVYWGHGDGRYSVDDTTHLSNGAGAWFLLHELQYFVSGDVSGDGIADLVACKWYDEGLPVGYSNGNLDTIPSVLVYQGHDSRENRWGTEQTGREADWKLWTPPSQAYTERLKIIDQDGDGINDIVVTDNTDWPYACWITVIYGRRNDLPDSTAIETVRMIDSAHGTYAILSDVTGDSIPEIVANTGSKEVIKVYAGRRGQRLRDQYGSGNDTVPLAGKGFWLRPWAEIWGTHRVNEDYFSSGYSPLFDLGDANGDGIDDIWTFSYPGLIVYSGGADLDSLIDGFVQAPNPNGILVHKTAVLGDIDGSGLPTIAIGYVGAEFRDPGRVAYVHVNHDIPTGSYRSTRLSPNGFPSVAGVDPPLTSTSSMLSLYPNPTATTLDVAWSDPTRREAVITLTDAMGRTIRSDRIEPRRTRHSIDMTALPAGLYMVTLSVPGNERLTGWIIRNGE